MGWVKWLRVGAEGRVRDFLLNYGAGVGGGGQPGAAIGPVRLQQRDKTWREEKREKIRGDQRRSEASATSTTSTTSTTSAASSSSGGENTDGRGRNLSCPHVTLVHFPIFSTSSQHVLHQQPNQQLQHQQLNVISPVVAVRLEAAAVEELCFSTGGSVELPSHCLPSPPPHSHHSASLPLVQTHPHPRHLHPPPPPQ